MIICQNCGKENQDHYKFCLGCGSELQRDQALQKPVTDAPPRSGTSAGSQQAARSASAPAAAAVPATGADAGAAGAAASGGGAPQAAPSTAVEAPADSSPASSAAADTVTCPRCSTVNPSSFKFCGSCGYDLQSLDAEPTVGGPAPVAATAVAAGLVKINPDGSEGEHMPLGDSGLLIGRSQTGFSDDGFLSPEHATVKLENGTMTVKDLNSLNGVWYRIPAQEPQPLQSGAMFRIGQELIQYEDLPAPESNGVETMGSPREDFIGRLLLVTGRESQQNSLMVRKEGIHIGRERGDVIFPEDGYVSGLHARVHLEGDKVCITDVGSSNGTYLRVEGERSLTPGTFLLMGQQILRVDF